MTFPRAAATGDQGKRSADLVPWCAVADQHAPTRDPAAEKTEKTESPPKRWGSSAHLTRLVRHASRQKFARPTLEESQGHPRLGAGLKGSYEDLSEFVRVSDSAADLSEFENYTTHGKGIQ